MIEKSQPSTMELPTCSDRVLWDVWMSTCHLSAITVADELGLFSLLEKKPMTAEEIVKTCSLKMGTTEAFLGILTSLGFLVQHQGRFYITEVSRNFLLPKSPYYWGGVLRIAQEMLNMHSAIKEILRDSPLNDKSKERKIPGMVKNLMENKGDEEQARLLTQVLHSRSFPAALGVARWGDFKGVHKLLDVGGGSGCFCIALAMQYPEIYFTIIDLPVICNLAEQYIADYRLQNRIDTRALDMFKDPWPSGYDAILFSNIFHDWDREQCLSLGQRSFDVLPPGGHIYLHELLLSDTKDSPLTLTSYSMVVSLFSEGRLFTAGELDELLRECGFEDISVTHTYGYHSLISGRKP